MSRRLRVAAITVVALSTLSLAPVTSAVDAADYLIWRSWASGRKAIVLLEDTSAGARVSAAVKGLENGTTYAIIGTNENGGCATAVTTANRTFVVSVVGNTQANGTFEIRNVSGDTWKTTQFVRIREQGGGTWRCGAANLYMGGVTVASGAFARFASQGELRGIVLVESLANGRERLSVALGDINGDATDDISVRGTPKACGIPTGTVTFAIKLENVLISSFKSTTTNMSQSEVNGLRSVRIRKLTGDTGQDWFPECQPSILIGLLVP